MRVGIEKAQAVILANNNLPISCPGKAYQECTSGELLCLEARQYRCGSQIKIEVALLEDCRQGMTIRGQAEIRIVADIVSHCLDCSIGIRDFDDSRAAEVGFFVV